MREILFRGKPVGGAWNTDWVYGAFCPQNSKGNIPCIIVYNGKVAGHRFEVIPETVGQYTGLTDKNGTKIFEGDIIEHHTQGDIIVDRGVVNWDGESARWAYQLNTMNPCFALYKPDFSEVIGNIHNNPELIGGEQCTLGKS